MDIDTFRRLKKEYGYADTFHTIAKDRAARSTVNSQTSMSGLLMTTTGAMMGLAGATVSQREWNFTHPCRSPVPF